MRPRRAQIWPHGSIPAVAGACEPRHLRRASSEETAVRTRTNMNGLDRWVVGPWWCPGPVGEFIGSIPKRPWATDPHQVHRSRPEAAAGRGPVGLSEAPKGRFELKPSLQTPALGPTGPYKCPASHRWSLMVCRGRLLGPQRPSRHIVHTL